MTTDLSYKTPEDYIRSEQESPHIFGIEQDAIHMQKVLIDWRGEREFDLCYDKCNLLYFNCSDCWMKKEKNE